MRRLSSIVLLAILALAGCTGDPPASNGDDGPTGPVTHEAPWWPVGDYWVLDLQRADGSTETFRLVNFWNDSATSHFWLGVSDRGQALDMALHDDNPFLGRIHWNLLTPHERGIHAHGMYTFPVRVGDQFGGIAFDREWSIDAKEGSGGRLLFTGTSSDRDTIEYDYDPESEWFTYLEIKDRNGARVLRADIQEHGSGESGTFYFLRGRDYATIEDPAGGPHEETFEVKQEEIPHDSLAFEVVGTVSGGPLTMTLHDPDGTLRHNEVLPVGAVRRVVEVDAPKVGTWTVRFAGLGSLDGTVDLTGILSYSSTL